MAPESWLNIPKNSPNSLANIPFGVISTAESPNPVTAVAVGEFVLNLAIFAEGGGFAGLGSAQKHVKVFQKSCLNDFAALGRPFHKAVREYLQEVFSKDTKFGTILRDNKDLRKRAVIPRQTVQTHLPLQIGAFSDFYGGMNHAVNAGALYRGQAGALLPNYLHLPMAYHGRASSIVPSGTPVRRPTGQVVKDFSAVPRQPVFETCKTMDFELELGALVCKENPMGQAIDIKDAPDYIFGYVLVNDWSARDIQRWEYVPLGPFNGKNFATAISAWVVLADALEPFRTQGLKNPETLLPYLDEEGRDSVHDLRLSVTLQDSATHTVTTICETNAAKGLVWSFPQMLAHHTVTGCPMKVGDLLGSGTISGESRDSLGCLLEQTLNGKEPITLDDGQKRTWLEDGDIVTLRAWAGTEVAGYVGFGECQGKLLPPLESRHTASKITCAS